MLDGDSKIIINWLSSPVDMGDTSHPILVDLTELISMLVAFEAVHDCREANSAAYWVLHMLPIILDRCSGDLVNFFLFSFVTFCSPKPMHVLILGQYNLVILLKIKVLQNIRKRGGTAFPVNGSSHQCM